MIRHYKKALQTKQAWRAFSLSGSRVALRVWSATAGLLGPLSALMVSIHALRVECDTAHRHLRHTATRFNPRTPCGVRRWLMPSKAYDPKFQSTHSVWSATVNILTKIIYQWFQSTHSVWSATTAGTSACPTSWFQSTHSVWSATLHSSCNDIALNGFNPRTPCGVRHTTSLSISASPMFQSTHSVWSATVSTTTLQPSLRVSIHALRVECDGNAAFIFHELPVSIHALRVECDCLG